MKNFDGLLHKGMTALQAGRLRDAERCFRQAVELSPRHFGALNLLTVALTGLERFEEAEAFAERALRIDASSDATHYNYGTVLKHNNKLEQAIAAFDAALAINPRHVKALNNRGAAYSQLERYEEALADFDRALALDRRYGDAYYNKANALAGLKCKMLPMHDDFALRGEFIIGHNAFESVLCVLNRKSHHAIILPDAQVK